MIITAGVKVLLTADSAPLRFIKVALLRTAVSFIGAIVDINVEKEAFLITRLTCFGFIFFFQHLFIVRCVCNLFLDG